MSDESTQRSDRESRQMTETAETVEKEPAVPAEAEAPVTVAEQASEVKKKDPVRKWTLIVLILLAVLFGWYLLADRFTPYTTQARLHALVVPISPLISGLVEEVYVANNQKVAAGDLLFRLNTDTYELISGGRRGRSSVGASSGRRLGEASCGRSKRLRSRPPRRAGSRPNRTRSGCAVSEPKIQERSRSAASSTLRRLWQRPSRMSRPPKPIWKRPGRTSGSWVRTTSGSCRRRSPSPTPSSISNAPWCEAPDDGVVTNVRLDVGNFAGSGQAQMTFISTDNLWVQADFTENNLGHVAAGNKVQIHFDVLPGRLFEGVVRGTGFGVDVDTAPLGELPTIENDKNWLREAQRFPVLVDLETDTRPGARRAGRLTGCGHRLHRRAAGTQRHRPATDAAVELSELCLLARSRVLRRWT